MKRHSGDTSEQTTQYAADKSRFKKVKAETADGDVDAPPSTDLAPPKNPHKCEGRGEIRTSFLKDSSGQPGLFSPFLGENGHHLAHRYRLYNEIWGHQKHAIESILNSANNTLFANLLSYIQDPFSDRLDVAFLGLSSNVANNLRLLDEFCAFAAADPACAHVKVVRLSSKLCVNIKTAVKEMIRQIVEGTESAHEVEEFKDDEDDEVGSDGEELAEDDDDDDDNGDSTGGRISYDFEIVQDWMDVYVRKHKCDESLRIVVFLDDSDGFSNSVLNQLLQLVCIYTSRFPIKMVMALSSRNVGDWINSNVTSRLRTLIEGVKLEAKENKDIGFQVVDEILLQNEITSSNPLLLDAHLSSIVLNRFENSNNSIDSLTMELKLSYMIHFYQSPLAVLVDRTYTPEKFHYDALRKLPSFKMYIEHLVDRFRNEPDAGHGKKILKLLQNNKDLKTLFDQSRDDIQKYQNAVMNAVNMVYWLCGGSTEKFQIYKWITDNQFINSEFCTSILKRFSTFREDDLDEFVSFLTGPQIRDSIGDTTDDDIVKLQEKLSVCVPDDIMDIITEYFHSNRHLNMKISDNLFNEILTIKGGRSELDELKPTVNIEENYRDLMINLIRPVDREGIETDLGEPQQVLRNPLIMEMLGKKKKMAKLLGPPLCKLYDLYKEAGVSINLYDYYVAFRDSLSKTQVVSEIDRCLETTTEKQKANMLRVMDLLKQEIEQEKQVRNPTNQSGADTDETWKKLVYAWFLEGIFELKHVGILKDKSKENYLEKLIWKDL